MLLILLVERAEDGPWRRATGEERSRSDLERGLWQHRERTKGKSKLAFFNTNVTIKKGRTTKAREKCWLRGDQCAKELDEMEGWTNSILRAGSKQESKSK